MAAEAIEAEQGDPYEKSRCQELVSKAFVRCPKIRVLADALSALGVEKDKLVHCIHCPSSEAAGGYMPSQREVVLCQQWVSREPSEVENTLAHEMIHAYDDARAFIDWNNLTQHACTEIRAAHISGDCSFRRELDRGNLFTQYIAGAGDRCVRRRAELSLTMSCGDADAAHAAVNRAWKVCRNDFAPFERGQV
ncbi:hypothetical protein AB1Y20_008102 [Prymnesium parvum]|uniref:Mitochondrial inner membrane protease ATP23 n=1 Tax=Prymnesium parvum TaxID=97485 RepID=A0AB34IVF8_PRYPA